MTAPSEYLADRATWIALLGCGCEARVQSEPKIGGYLTCVSPRHQSPYRINSAVQMPDPDAHRGDAG